MDLVAEELITMQRRMMLIRLFDERASTMVARGEIPGTVHTSIGQEAQVVGSCMALRDGDFITGNHRSHGHPIGKGSPVGPLMAELLGKESGVCRGKGGSLHLADFKVGSLGESGIVGSSIPIATGAGLSAKVTGSGAVAMAFFGDGAANQGALHESMNMASVWKLPVIFLCENNQYALTTPARTVTAGDLTARAAGYSMPGVKVEDGQDVVAVYDAVKGAVDAARDGRGPAFIEVVTYRYHEHSEGLRNHGDYRDEGERESWLARDPIAIFAQHLADIGVLSPAENTDLYAEVEREIDAAVEFARESDYPEPASAYDYLYTDTVFEGVRA